MKRLPRKFFAPAPWKNVLYIFKNIGHSLKNLTSSQKTLRPPGVPSWLWACIHNNERRKGMGRRGHWKNLTFSYQIFSKKVVFLISSEKNKIPSFLAYPIKILRFT